MVVLQALAACEEKNIAQSEGDDGNSFWSFFATKIGAHRPSRFSSSARR
jgi:hypothetical protein